MLSFTLTQRRRSASYAMLMRGEAASSVNDEMSSSLRLSVLMLLYLLSSYLSFDVFISVSVVSFHANCPQPLYRLPSS